MYGEPPCSVAVIHGGPGATGEMAPVAQWLSRAGGVLEPLQDASSIDGLAGQLRSDIEGNMKTPVTLIGHSWGAWLAFIFTAKNPAMVGKLILVSSGPFEDRYVPSIMKTRLSRLNETEKELFTRYLSGLGGPSDPERPFDIGPLKRMLMKTDAFDPEDISGPDDDSPFVGDSYWNIWDEAERLRKSGELLKMGRTIKCPVIAMHGDYDPHPADGVSVPLSEQVRDFRFFLLEKCGHYPWREKQAKGPFFEMLAGQLS